MKKLYGDKRILTLCIFVDICADKPYDGVGFFIKEYLWSR